MEKLTPDFFGTLEADVIRKRDLIESPDTDPEDKDFIERMAVASVDYSADVGRITNEQRAELLRILGMLV